MPRTGIILACLLLLAPPAQADEPAYRTGPWRAWLESPGGELPFGLMLARTLTPTSPHVKKSVWCPLICLICRLAALVLALLTTWTLAIRRCTNSV